MPTPVSLGASGTGSAGTTATLSAIANIQAGDLVVVAIGSSWSTQIVSSISDGTNTYVKATGVNGTGGWSGVNTEFWYANNCSAVTSPTLTVTFSNASTANKVICAARCPSMDTSAPLDKSGAQTQGTGGSISTGTLSQAQEVVFGFAHANAAPSASSGFTQLNSTSATQFLQLEYKSVSSTAAVSIAPGGSQTFYNIGFSTFKNAAASTGLAFNMPNMGL